jgi:hypothetical protein
MEAHLEVRVTQMRLVARIAARLTELDKHGEGGRDPVFARRALADGKAGVYEVIFKRPL